MLILANITLKDYIEPLSISLKRFTSENVSPNIELEHQTGIEIPV
jgi:hypothetical protein